MDSQTSQQPRSTGLVIQLMGRPCLQVDGERGYRFRSRKSWAVLAFLLLGERPPTRSRLASLLFADADDPLRALRWSLAEIRRGLGPEAVLDGDPVRLTLPPGAIVDVDVLVHGHWREAVDLPGLGADLLDGLGVQNAAAFESWLLSARRRLATATESILHEAALGHLARGELDRARDLRPPQATVLSPLDENHQALLIRLYRLAGDDHAAELQFTAWSATAQSELGTPPGAAVRLAMRERPDASRDAVDATSIQAIVEAGEAAVAAGAVSAGVRSFETAVRLADRSDAPRLRVETRLVLGQALIHSLGGLDEEGVANLTEAEGIALSNGDAEPVARARTELGYVDFLRARYDRADDCLGQVLAQAAEPSDARQGDDLPRLRGQRPRRLPTRDVAAASEATELSRTALDPRREAYCLLDVGPDQPAPRRPRRRRRPAARRHGTGRARRTGCRSYPGHRHSSGEVQLCQDDAHGAAAHPRAVVRPGLPDRRPVLGRDLGSRSRTGCRVGGRHRRGLHRCSLDARVRSHRLADSYAWLDVHILDAMCTLGRRHAHAGTPGWVAEMRERASRTGMRELSVRALIHGAALGDVGDAALAGLLADEIDNPVLRPLVGP